MTGCRRLVVTPIFTALCPFFLSVGDGKWARGGPFDAHYVEKGARGGREGGGSQSEKREEMEMVKYVTGNGVEEEEKVERKERGIEVRGGMESRGVGNKHEDDEEKAEEKQVDEEKGQRKREKE